MFFFLSNAKVVLEAVKQQGDVLRIASEELKGDKEVKSTTS